MLALGIGCMAKGAGTTAEREQRMKNQIAESFVHEPTLDRERLLVQRMKEGNEAALEELIEKYGGKIYRLALQYTRNVQDAEEVLQDVFLKVFCKIETFRGTERFSPWLYKIAVNTALMKLREQKKRHTSTTISLEDWALLRGTKFSEPPSEILADWSQDAEDAMLRKEVQQEVRSAIDKLPIMYRMAVQLHDIDGFSLEDVSGILGISIPAVKSRAHRGRLMVHRTISRFMAQKRKTIGL